MTTEDQAIAAAVKAAMKESGVSTERLAQLTQIPYTTLYRRLTGTTSFTTSQLIQIGLHLGRPASSFVSAAEGEVA